MKKCYIETSISRKLLRFEWHMFRILRGIQKPYNIRGRLFRLRVKFDITAITLPVYADSTKKYLLILKRIYYRVLPLTVFYSILKLIIKPAKFNLNSSLNIFFPPNNILFSILTQLHVIVCNILINCSSKSEDTTRHETSWVVIFINHRLNQKLFNIIWSMQLLKTLISAIWIFSY